MQAKGIKELRLAGRLEEALKLAKDELQFEPDNDLFKRNISWVYYDFVKRNNTPEHFEEFISWITEIINLNLSFEEVLLFEKLSWQVGKMIFGIINSKSHDFEKGIRLFEVIKVVNFTRPTEGYSFMFKAFHKLFKETDYYIQFADWWGFNYFISSDYHKEILANGKEVMSLVEQAYITYAKHLLPKKNSAGEIIFDKENVKLFLIELSAIIELYPQYQYPAYFKAKLLLALGDKNNMLESLLPFAKKKRNDFWVWEILAEAFSTEPEKAFACYCKALTCKSPEEMIVNLRQKMARLFISKKLYNEAKTEIELLVNTRSAHNYKIPSVVSNWQIQNWYKTAISSISNISFYKTYVPIAEALLFNDVPEEIVIVEFVNADKKMLNFIASENKFGVLKYDRFFSNVKVGDTLKVRFKGDNNEGLHQLYTAIKVDDIAFEKQFIKELQGEVRIPAGKSFGFIDDIFIHPSLVKKYKLADGIQFTGKAIKSYNQEKKQWGWKLL